MYLNIAVFPLIYINEGSGEYIDLLRLNLKLVLIVSVVGAIRASFRIFSIVPGAAG